MIQITYSFFRNLNIFRSLHDILSLNASPSSKHTNKYSLHLFEYLDDSKEKKYNSLVKI